MRASIGAGCAVALFLLAGLGIRGDGASAQPLKAAGAAGQPAIQRMPEAGGKTSNPQLLELDQKIKAMREELHSQLDPLEAQVKSLHEKYDPQIKDLVDQRRTLAEQGKPPAIQQLDSQEEAELASLADREKAEIEKVKQSYEDQRKDVQRKYEEQRKALGRH